MTLEESLKLVLAIIGIFLLVYLLISLYGILGRKNKIEMAKAMLEEIKGKIDQLQKEGEIKQVLINGPKDWYLVGFNSPIPFELCGGGAKHCLCFCPESFASSCRDEGICKPFLNVLDTRGPYHKEGTTVGWVSFGQYMKIEGINTLTLKYYSEGIYFHFGEETPDNAIFYNMLKTKANFNGNEKTFEDAIRDYRNSGDRTIWNPRDSDSGKAVESNIKNYFASYPYSVKVSLLGPYTIAVKTKAATDALSFTVGGGKSFDENNPIALPVLYINNPTGEGSIEGIAITFEKK